jgi:hypothetical protein
MQSPLRTTLFLAALSLTPGCSFFSIDNPEQPLPKKGAAGNTGAAGMAGQAGSGTGGTTGGSAGSPSGSGAGGGGSGTGGSGAGGSGGSSGAGVAGDSTGAGMGGGAGDTTMLAGAGGASGGMPASGGIGGDATAAGGNAAAGMPGAGGFGGDSCMALMSDAKDFGGHCYLLVTNAVAFSAAKMDCMTKQAHLVTISNGDPASKDTFDAEDAFVYQMAGGKDTWLGLADGKMDRDPGDGTPYTWITGEPNPPAEWGTAYGWVQGEPNNYKKNCMNGDTCYEHCGYMVSDQGDKWNDDLCEATKQYVCEWDMPPAAAAQ